MNLTLGDKSASLQILFSDLKCIFLFLNVGSSSDDASGVIPSLFPVLSSSVHK